MFAGESRVYFGHMMLSVFTRRKDPTLMASIDSKQYLNKLTFADVRRVCSSKSYPHAIHKSAQMFIALLTSYRCNGKKPSNSCPLR